MPPPVPPRPAAALRITRAVLREVVMPLVSPFESSHGRQSRRRFLLVQVHAGALCGYGECCAMEGPWYTEETVGTARSILAEFLLPQLLRGEFGHPGEVAAWFRPIRRNRMARAAAEMACWDLYAQAVGQPLHRLLGATRARVQAGVAVGIQPDLASLVGLVRVRLDQGYRRVKLKIRPGWDAGPVAELRRAYGDGLALAVDANAAYTPADLAALQALDGFGLAMIEQPLAAGDLQGHAALQARLRTPLCLDEGIASVEDARRALELGACRVISIKPSRVGGLQVAREIHDLCLARAVPVCCGGMLESGVGRAHNIALAALPGFSLPGDISASARYWERDIVDPPVRLDADGTIAVPAAPGRGWEVDLQALRARTIGTETFVR